MQLEGFVGVVFPDDALEVVLRNQSLPGLGELDIHHVIESSVIELIKKNLTRKILVARVDASPL